MIQKYKRLIASVALLSLGMVQLPVTGELSLRIFAVESATAQTTDNADLSITKSGPSSVEQGTTISYSVVVTNSGPDTATNVTVADTIPSGLTFNAGSSDSNCIQQGNDILCNSFSLSNGESQTVMIAFDVPSGSGSCGSTINNQASVATSATDPNSGNNQSNTVNTTITCPLLNLNFSKTAPTTAFLDSIISYTLSASNSSSTETAMNVQIIDTFPTNLTFVSSPICQTGTNANELICDVGNMDPGASFTTTVEFRIDDDSLSCGSSISNTAQITGDNVIDGASATSTLLLCQECRDGADNDNDGDIDFPADSSCTSRDDDDESGPSNADLSIVKTGPSTVDVGNTVAYTIVVTNAGPDTATDITISDAIPSGLTFDATQSSSNCVQNGSDVLCNSFSLDTNTSMGVTIAFNVPSSFTCDSTISNQASVSTSVTDPDSGNNQSLTVSTTALCPNLGADLQLDMDGPSTILRGDDITYEILITNFGPEDAQNLSIENPIPTIISQNLMNLLPLIFVSGSSDSRCSISGNDIICDGFDLAANGTEMLELVFTVPAEARCGRSISNEATVTSTTSDPSIGNNRDGIASTTNCSTTTLDITKSGPSSANRGEEITYIVTITNNLGYDAINARLIDPILSGLAFVRAIGTNSSLCGKIGNEVICNSFNLDAGESIQFQLVFRILDNATCDDPVLNIADVWLDNADPSWSNPVETTVFCPASTFSIFKTDGRTNAVAGEILTYSIDVTNTSSSGVATAVVTDTIPSNTSFSFASNGGTLSNGVVTWPGANIAAGATQIHILQVIVDSSTPNNTVITNTAVVNGGASSTDTTVISGLTSTFSITKTDGRTTAAPNDTLTYTINVTNTSSSGVATATITDTIPSNTSFVSVSNGGAISNEVVTWSGLSISAGATQTLTLQVSINGSTPNNTVITNQAILNGGQSATDVTTVVTGGSANCNISIDLTDSRNDVEPDDEYDYIITLRNLNSQSISNETITLNLDNDVDFRSASNGGREIGSGRIEWDNISLSANGSLTLRATVRVDDDADDGDILYSTANTCSASDFEDTEVEDDFDDNDDVRININDSPDPIDICYEDEVEYDIVISNRRNSNERVDIIATLDSDMRYISSSAGGDRVGNSRVEWDDLVIGRNSTRTVRLIVRLDQDIRNGDTVQLRVFGGGDSDSEITRVRRNTNCDPVIPPSGGGNLTIDKSADRTEARPGDIISYTITIRNLETRDVINATLNDVFPSSQMTILDAGGGSISNGNILWNLGRLRANSTTVVRYRAQLSRNLRQGEVVRNTATIQGDGFTRSDIHQVIIPNLPQTGLGVFSSALKHSKDLLSPSKGSQPSRNNSNSANGTLPLTIWITIILTGLGLGAEAGRRIILL